MDGSVHCCNISSHHAWKLSPSESLNFSINCTIKNTRITTSKCKNLYFSMQSFYHCFTYYTIFSFNVLRISYIIRFLITCIYYMGLLLLCLMFISFHNKKMCTLQSFKITKNTYNFIFVFIQKLFMHRFQLKF